MDATFKNLNINPTILKNIEKAGFEKPTPIQEKAIPFVNEGRDLLAAAQTGTGKTAAYVLPLSTSIIEERAPYLPRSPKVLVLTPTRELAAQVLESIDNFDKGTGLKAAAIFGGVGAAPQKARIAKGLDFLIATPGRLLDLVSQKAVKLSDTHVLVLDEADRMLDMGFIKDIRKIEKLLPKERQTLLFSATFSPEIRNLAGDFLKNPANVEIEKNQDASLVRQTLYRMPKSCKRDALRDLIVDNNWGQVLVFTRTKHGADRLVRHLKADGIDAMAIHGDKSQAARVKALQAFKDHTLRVLVATDIAARGLDIEKLPQIVNYELPQQAEDYVHRIGRTGRAGERGEAISLVCADERDTLKDIEKFIRKKLPLADFPGFDYSRTEDKTSEKPQRRKNPATERSGKARTSGPKAPRGASAASDKARTRTPSKASSRPRSTGEESSVGHQKIRQTRGVHRKSASVSQKKNQSEGESPARIGRRTPKTSALLSSRPGNRKS